MTTTYDPFHPKYFDEGDLREELTRVYDLCHGCRLCFKYCTSFPTLFSYVDSFDDQDAAHMTPAQQDQVVDECFQCKLCYVNCPYIPGQHEWALDFPRLMMRAEQVLRRNRPRSVKERITDKALASTDLMGRVGSATAPLTNRAVSKPGSGTRALMQKLVGIHAERVLPPYARTRFSTWFRSHSPKLGTDRRAERVAAVFPTCLVEYQDPEIGKALVGVYERNGIACDLPDGQVCCGMPWLDAGDVKKFEEHARKNVTVLAEAVKAGHDVVVPQPTCGYVLKNEYPDFLGTDDARLVAEHTFDSSEYLMLRHREAPLDTDFSAGSTYETITWQAACHYRAQQIGPKSRDVMKLTGAKVTMVERCSAIDGTWGLRAENVEMAKKIAKPLMEAVAKADTDLVAGDCHLSNTAIKEATGETPSHPLQVLARAYGLDDT